MDTAHCSYRGWAPTKKFDDLASECLARNIGSLSNKHAPTQASTLIYLRHTYAPNAADSLSPV